jgi:uncharacterized protein (DUF885 family)
VHVPIIVDTGLHSKGWTREQAIKFSMDNEAESEAGITTEIEPWLFRTSPPKLQLKIMELRKKGKD